MHHANMVHYVVAVIQEVLQQGQSLTEKVTTVPEPVNHVENTVQRTQKKLATQLNQMQEMMQTMKIQYAEATQHAHQDNRGRVYHGRHTNYCGQGRRGA